MPVISARLVRQPKTDGRCEECRTPLPAKHPRVVAFGCAEPGDKPYRILLCLKCGGRANNDAKIRRVVEGVT